MTCMAYRFRKSLQFLLESHFHHCISGLGVSRLLGSCYLHLHTLVSHCLCKLYDIIDVAGRSKLMQYTVHKQSCNYGRSMVDGSKLQHKLTQRNFQSRMYDSLSLMSISVCVIISSLCGPHYLTIVTIHGLCYFNRL